MSQVNMAANHSQGANDDPLTEKVFYSFLLFFLGGVGEGREGRGGGEPGLGGFRGG